MLDFVKKLVDKGLLTNSMAEIIYTADEERQKRLTSFKTTMTPSFRICMLYTALLQAYVVAKANFHDCKASSLPYKNCYHEIRKVWDPNNTPNSIDENVFSFLYTCAADNAPELSTEKTQANITRLRDLFRQMTNPNIRFEQRAQSFADIEALMESLPLLANTELDNTKGKLIFTSADKSDSFSIRAYPFLSFWDYEGNMSSTTLTESFVVLNSVRQASGNGPIVFDVRILDAREQRASSKTLSQEVKKDENLKMIFDKLDIDVKFSSVDNCLCDFKFMQKLTECTYTVMKEFWNRNDKTPKLNLTPKLKKMFLGSEIYSKIDDQREIKKEDLNNFFYEMFINYGIFNVMRGLFLDTKEWPYGEQLFTLYLNELERRGLTEWERAACEQEYHTNVERHLQQLKDIVSEGSKQYEQRSRFIYSEWRAFCILSAMGLKTDKLLTDEENIHSIDDYYDMIRNNQSQTTQGLRDVLLMLTGLYGSLLECDVPFNETQFSGMLEERYKLNRTKDIKNLISDFQDIVARSKSNANISYLLGRECICQAEKLDSYLTMIVDALDISSQEIIAAPKPKKKLFISYSHKDETEVMQAVAALRALLGDKCDIFVDNAELRGGKNWEIAVMKEMESPNCVAVITFMSPNAIKSNAVCFEIEHANKIQKRDGFIIAVNLAKEPLNDYLDAAVHDANNEEQHIASRLSEIFHSKSINRAWPQDLQKLMDDIEELLNAAPVEITQEREYDALELAVANFYALLKLGENCPDEWLEDSSQLDEVFKNSAPGGRSCVFPLVVSVKETKIKRDNVTLMGYEIIGGKEESERGTNYILSSRNLGTDDYYCIPGKATGQGCSWMVEPLLICHNLFPNISEEK